MSGRSPKVAARRKYRKFVGGRAYPPRQYAMPRPFGKSLWSADILAALVSQASSLRRAGERP